MIIHNPILTGSLTLNNVNLSTGNLVTTGSNTFVGNQILSGSLTVSGSVSATGTLTAQTLVVQTITSSVSVITGSTNFGSLSSNTHVFTGSMLVTGSITQTGTLTQTGTNSQILQTTANSVAGDNVAVLYNSNTNSYGLYIGAGSGSNHALYCTDYTRTANLFKVQGDGKVGIGTSTPTGNLEIFDNTNSGVLSLSRDNGQQRGIIRWGRNNGGTFQHIASIVGDSDTTSINNGQLSFWTSNNSGTITERMRILGNGNVGIGTNNPSTPLYVVGSMKSETGLYFNNTTTNGAFVWQEANKPLRFATNDIERLRISDSGNLQFNRTNTSAEYIEINQATNQDGGIVWQRNLGNRFQQTLNGSDGMQFYSYGISTTAFVINYNGSASLYGALTQNASDRRLKKNITNIPNALNKIQSLNGVTFTWDNEIYKTDRTNDIGVIAQEIQSVLPDAVTLAPFDLDDNGSSKSGENYLTVYYEKLIPLLIEGIKELKAEIDEYKTTHP